MPRDYDAERRNELDKAVVVKTENDITRYEDFKTALDTAKGQLIEIPEGWVRSGEPEVHYRASWFLPSYEARQNFKEYLDMAAGRMAGALTIHDADITSRHPVGKKELDYLSEIGKGDIIGQGVYRGEQAAYAVRCYIPASLKDAFFEEMPEKVKARIIRTPGIQVVSDRNMWGNPNRTDLLHALKEAQSELNNDMLPVTPTDRGDKVSMRFLFSKLEQQMAFESLLSQAIGDPSKHQATIRADKEYHLDISSQTREDLGHSGRYTPIGGHIKYLYDVTVQVPRERAQSLLDTAIERAQQPPQTSMAI